MPHPLRFLQKVGSSSLGYSLPYPDIFQSTGSMLTKPAFRPPIFARLLRSASLIHLREAHLAGVTDCRASLQVRFTDVGQVACRSGKATGAADDVRGIADKGKTRL